ncbi:MAG: ABC transporter substrate-binding protein [Myxococcota bacterium]|nr:ABC transporter substrate-binding protein [Myxococcota bacterium]
MFSRTLWDGFALVLVIGLSAFPAASDPALHPAVPVVEDLHGSMLETMKNADELGYSGRYDKLSEALMVSFDLTFMAQKAVGRNWKKFTPQEQEHWQSSFENVTAANYAGRFTGYTGQRFETLGTEPSSHDTIIVRTRLLNPDGDDVDLNYRLRETPEGWRIIDVYLNGTVSELALRRSEYSSLIKRDGFQSLVESVDKRVADLSAVN